MDYSSFAEAKLQLGNGYYLQFDLLAQLLNVVSTDERGRVPLSELALSIGVTDRNAKHLGALANALGLTKQHTYKPTALGELTITHDPFFDDPGTLWFLHYVISSNPRNIVWYRIVNEIIPTKQRFDASSLRDEFDDLRSRYSEYSIRTHVRKEVNTMLDAYLNQNFSRLAYLRADGDGSALSYRQPVPALVLAASIASFRDANRPEDSAIFIPDLLSSLGSPGVVFQMLEMQLRTLLEELKTQPGFSLESRADLDQVRLDQNLRDMDWMKCYYENR